MITQARSDELSLLLDQKFRRWNTQYDKLHLGERLDGNDQQEFDTDGSGLGSEPGSPVEGEPTTEGPGQHPSGDEAESPVETQIIG